MRSCCLIATGLLSFLSVLGCALNAPVSQDYYSGTGKIAGGNPPSVPVLTFTKSQLRVDFTASIDPESNAEVATYIVYIYNGVPQTFYQTRNIDNILTSPSPRTFYLPGLTSATGTYTIVLTGTDGYRESAVNDQNKVTFTLP